MQMTAEHASRVMGVGFKTAQAVSVYDPENAALFDMVTDRNQRLSIKMIDLQNFQRVFSHPAALEILGLPSDYCIEYPTEK